ncbi:hypothetical protein BGZ49_000029 [Haplosporangium sp. Z 27]|nr:hypothetical protein BGZ49_000029 [Haplosporangium sp. Z 27]
MANQRLNDTTGFIPGAGAGQDIFSLRGDCEDGSYCDLSTPGGGCLSLRCDESPFEPAKVTSRRKRTLLNFFRPTLEKRVYPNSTVCLSSKIHTHNSTGVNPDDGLGIGGSGDTDGGIVGNQHSSSFPKWMGAVIAIIVILGAAVIFGLARRRKKLRDEKEKKMKAASRTLTERERTRSMTSPTASSDEKNAHRYQVFSEQAQPRQKDQRTGILGMFFGSKRQSGDQVNDTSMFYTHRKRADTPSGAEASFVSIEESNASVDSISMERVNTHNEPEPSLSAIEYPDTMPDVSTTEDSQHNPGLGLSIVIPSITTTPSELQQSAERNVFEEGEMPMLPIRYPGGLTPSVNESEAAPSISSYYGTSLSDSSSAYSGSSSHAFLSTLPPTSPHVPNSPISPISPRPLPSTGPSSRLSYRLSTQVTSRKS